ncbi:MAG: hypothetical protein GY805_21810, partial [Chloroflexi bacterium]|nr:hypothetical protein [Chloroflexota bacterium]
MKEQEILANELDHHIAAKQRGKKQPAVSKLIQPEAILATKLVNLADGMHPRTEFAADLGYRLAQLAAKNDTKQKNNPVPKRLSLQKRPFLQQFLQQLKEGTIMNRNKYLVGALGALILVVGLFIFMNRDGDDRTEPTTAVIDSSDSSDGSDGSDTVADNNSETAETAETADVTNLPTLPLLEANQAVGLGGGGGGGGNVQPQASAPNAAAETAVLSFDQSSFIYTDPFSGTTFVLNT